ncbi:hypothetical protein AMTR_s00062p00188910 [Amborella trichopoda]|uniref:Uncharacterized protein n=1 Tax=Amborella trichopoda TaxID=13333 RepID=U5DE43_AMBTC|nr:hypothetical protein AMTR_s00062p00188910 [Amborella trichopoda]
MQMGMWMRQEDAEIYEVSQQFGALAEMAEKPSVKVITTAMVDSWCKSIQEEKSIRPLRLLIQASDLLAIMVMAMMTLPQSFASC